MGQPVQHFRARQIAGGCLGFFKSIDDPALRISGWSCRGNSLPAERNAVACMLDRLTLLSAVHTTAGSNQNDEE